MTSILRVEEISKAFPGVQALDKVSVDFIKGEVHALVGMNGSGKSTLMKILTGVLKQDSGDIIMNGEKQNINSVRDSRNLGISLVYQELSLVPCLTVAENIFLGHPVSKMGLVSISEAKKKAAKLLSDLGININVNAYVEDLPVAEKQMVEIAKALSINETVLLLDEPSAVLTQNELDNLFRLIRSLKKNGVTIIYISHRLEEVFEIADRVTVLRDGKLIGTRTISELEPKELIRMMIGRTLDELFPELESAPLGIKALEIRNMRSDKLSDIDIEVLKKEIIGIYGVVGSGQKELAEALFGVHAEGVHVDEYNIYGKQAKIKNPFDAIKNGLAYIPEERKEDGLMLGLNVRDNTLITFLETLKNWLGIMKKDSEKEKTSELIQRLEVKTPSQEVLVSNLSGGNQQKVVIAKWLGKGSKTLICFEPTRGIDVNAKAQVYKALEQIRREGASVIIISSELSEVLGMCDKLYVMRKGKIVGSFNRDEMDQELILSKASGLEV